MQGSPVMSAFDTGTNKPHRVRILLQVTRQQNRPYSIKGTLQRRYVCRSDTHTLQKQAQESFMRTEVVL